MNNAPKKEVPHMKLGRKIRAAIDALAGDIEKVVAQVAKLEGLGAAEHARSIQSALKFKGELSEKKVGLEERLALAEIEARKEEERGDADNPRERLVAVEKAMVELKGRCEFMLEENARVVGEFNKLLEKAKKAKSAAEWAEAVDTEEP